MMLRGMTLVCAGLHAESSLRERGLSLACFSSSRVVEIVEQGYTFDAGNFIIISHSCRRIQPGIPFSYKNRPEITEKNVPFGEFSF